MREFRFRAWDTVNKKMIESPLAICSGKGGWVLFTREIENLNSTDAIHPIEQYELMQYTGLVDRHGKTICEGDILRWLFDGEQILYVEWEYNYFKLVEVRNKDANVMVADKRSLEIIGNIYETPDLLKEGHPNG